MRPLTLKEFAAAALAAARVSDASLDALLDQATINLTERRTAWGNAAGVRSC
jgi:hypothetical protein